MERDLLPKLLILTSIYFFELSVSMLSFQFIRSLSEINPSVFNLLYKIILGQFWWSKLYILCNSVPNSVFPWEATSFQIAKPLPRFQKFDVTNKWRSFFIFVIKMNNLNFFYHRFEFDKSILILFTFREERIIHSSSERRINIFPHPYSTKFVNEK